MKTDGQAYLAELLREVERLRGLKRTKLFRINEQISDDVADYVIRFFKADPEFEIEARKCYSCAHTWDIILSILIP